MGVILDETYRVITSASLSKISSFCPGNVTYFIESYFAELKNAPLRCRTESLEACLVLAAQTLKT